MMVKEVYRGDRQTAFPAILVSFIIFFLPFYEGGARPESLFIVHSLLFVLGLYTGLQVFKGDGGFLFIPGIIVFFIPFLVYFFIRAFLVPYLYASFLSLWEVLAFVFFLCLTFHFSRRRGFLRIVLLSLFLSAVFQAFLAILLYVCGGFRRTAVFFMNPNHLAAYLSIGFFIGAFFLMRFLLGEENEKKWMRLFIPGLILILAALILGSSRGALLSFALAFVILPVSFFLKRRKRESLIALLILIIVLLTGAFLIYERFGEGLDIYRYERIRIWRASLGVFLDNPLFGVGPGLFEYHSLNYNFPQLESPIRYGRFFSAPHSDYILILSELGIAGFLLLFIPFIFVLWKAARKKNDGDPVSRENALRSPTKIVMVCIITAFLGQSFFDNLSERPALYMSMAVVGGVLIAEVSKNVSMKLRMTFLRRGIVFSLCFIVPMIYLYYCAVLAPFVSDLLIKKAKRMSAEMRETDALRYCNEAIFFNAINPDYYALRGDIRLRMLKEGTLRLNDFSGIDEDFAEASRFNAIDASYLMDRARLFRELLSRGFAFDELQRNSIRLYRDAGSLSPKDPLIPYELAILFYERGELKNAEKECLASLSIEPCFFQASLLLAWVYFDLGDHEKARAVIGGMEKVFKEIEGYRVKNKYEYEILHYDRERYLYLKDIIGQERSGPTALR